MKREIRTTADGSVTIHIPEWNEQYHSMHGAINEAQHVFIQMGLSFLIASETIAPAPISILEIGFGTGLNAFLTALYAETNAQHIHYTGVEAYPVQETEIAQLNYTELLNASPELFQQLHSVPWGEAVAVSTNFTLHKRQQFFSEINDRSAYHLIYFDAFGARVQPELWTQPIFQSMYEALQPGGVLVTYSAKGSVRRAMQVVGFEVERLPGPPGKREMLRGIKVVSGEK
ncbi:MAG: tRNA (5-methylaminomethyl-2-thiouridine)(34)-methyltransferase MnmD [Bacteroidota bacterium]